MDRFLADRDWDIGYSSDQGNPIADFYIPALERSVQYDRKAGFFNSSISGEIKLLLCTESASEGLNLQTCGLLINYDLPWNPMRVEQRIGRIDRIGQTHTIVTIRNFYYDGTVEAKVYGKLRDRINAFTTVVGNLQPILAQVPTFIEQAAFSADPQEEDVLLAQFERVLEMPPLRPSLDEMVAMDVVADLAELEKPIPPNQPNAGGDRALVHHSQNPQIVGHPLPSNNNTKGLGMVVPVK